MGRPVGEGWWRSLVGVLWDPSQGHAAACGQEFPFLYFNQHVCKSGNAGLLAKALGGLLSAYAAAHGHCSTATDEEVRAGMWFGLLRVAHLAQLNMAQM